MARTTDEIKKELQTEWMANETLSSLYGFTTGISFTAFYSKVSIESLLLYIVAYCAHTVEVLMDAHKNDVDVEIASIIPHRPLWYRNKALAWQNGDVLPEGEDIYDSINVDKQTVTYATAYDSPDSSLLIIKVAKGDTGELMPLTAEEMTLFEAYMAEIKDAGVRLSIVSQAGDPFACVMDVLYSAEKEESEVINDVKRAIKEYLNGLPFNGEYSNMALTDAVQSVEGVKVVEFRSASSGSGIDTRFTPAAGYFTYDDDNITINMKAYA